MLLLPSGNPSHGTPGFPGAQSGDRCCEACACFTCGLGCTTCVWAENPPHRQSLKNTALNVSLPAQQFSRVTAERPGSAAWDSSAQCGLARYVRKQGRGCWSAASWTACHTCGGEPGEHHSKGNKPVSEDHTSHVVPFTWNVQVRQAPTQEGRQWLPQAGALGENGAEGRTGAGFLLG